MPGKASEASLITASISASLRTVKPCRISSRKVPPGGSSCGLVLLSNVSRKAFLRAFSTVYDRRQSSLFYRDHRMHIPCLQLPLPNEVENPRSSIIARKVCQAAMLVSIGTCACRIKIHLQEEDHKC